MSVVCSVLVVLDDCDLPPLHETADRTSAMVVVVIANSLCIMCYMRMVSDLFSGYSSLRIPVPRCSRGGIFLLQSAVIFLPSAALSVRTLRPMVQKFPLCNICRQRMKSSFAILSPWLIAL